uniref:Minor tail protein n=1 Tax=Angiostrongylus cantonensis TaxID=6313 RepID=A0A0K0DF42_ANGCA
MSVWTIVETGNKYHTATGRRVCTRTHLYDVLRPAGKAAPDLQAVSDSDTMSLEQKNVEISPDPFAYCFEATLTLSEFDGI